MVYDSIIPESFFIVKSGNEWLKEAMTRPIPKQLFSEFWFEGELSILFADTNLGKSILAVQIASSLTQGQAIPGFSTEAEAQKVLYCDFELSDKQFEARYSDNFQSHYQFSDNFLRLEINRNADLDEGQQGVEKRMQSNLADAIDRCGARIVIIDNLTYLKTGTEQAKDALPLMKFLKALKCRYNLSILALAHTPKRNPFKPLDKNDLQGSKMLINFCDSAFAIGESHLDKSLRYLKQIKQRNTEHVYDAENVCICRIVKPGNFLQFEYTGTGSESSHLIDTSSNTTSDYTETVARLRTEGKSIRAIEKRSTCFTYDDKQDT